jgi:hypothetical protein
MADEAKETAKLLKNPKHWLFNLAMVCIPALITAGIAGFVAVEVSGTETAAGYALTVKAVETLQQQAFNNNREIGELKVANEMLQKQVRRLERQLEMRMSLPTPVGALPPDAKASCQTNADCDMGSMCINNDCVHIPAGPALAVGEFPKPAAATAKFSAQLNMMPLMPANIDKAVQVYQEKK